MDEAMNHKDAGINKRVSEAVYPADILSDETLIPCELKTKGAWFWCLLIMWRTKTNSITKTVSQFARLWGCSEDDARDVIADMVANKPCVVTESPEGVTLLSRRLTNRKVSRKQASERKAAQRSRESHAPVPPEKPLPSISSSSSSSISTSPSRKKKIGTSLDYTDQFLEFWNACPRKSGKQAGMKSFQGALTVVEYPVLLTQMKAYAMAMRETKQKHIAMPSTWLNQHRWEDEPTTTKPPQQENRWISG